MDQNETPVIKHPGLILLAAAFGSFLATFNETFFNVALVPIMNDLAVSASAAQWLVTINMLVAAVFVPIAGFLYRMVSTRVLYLVATGSLIVGSAVGYLAPNFAVLLVARAIQAIGAGMVPVVCMNMTLAAAPRNRLGTYIGIVGAMTTLGPSSSPLVAGIVLNFATWHELFLVYGIVSTLTFIYGAIALCPVAEITKPKLDIASTVLICVGLIGIMYGISTAFSGDVAVAAATFIVGLVAMVLFVRRQLAIDNPLIDLRPFRSRAYTVGALCVLMSLMSVFSMNVIMPTFMQDALGFASLAASLTLFPAVACACIFSPIGGRCYDRWGIKFLAPGGMSVLFIFEIALLALVTVFGLDTPSIWIAVLYAPVIAGAQFVIGPSQSFALSSLPRQLNTHGVVILSTIFQIAGCLGTSLFMGVYSMGEASALASGAAETVASMHGFMASCVVAIIVAALGVILGLIAAKYERSGQAAPSYEEEEAALHTSILDSVMRRDVFTVNSSDSLYDTLAVMAEKKTNGIPIVDDEGALVGFIDSGDITRYLSGEQAESASYAIYMMWNDSTSFREKIGTLKDVNVMELATTRIISVEYSDGIEAVSRVLSHHSIKKVPIVQDGVVVGIVSRSDLMRHFWEEGVALEKGE